MALTIDQQRAIAMANARARAAADTSAPTNPPKQESFASSAGRALWNLPMDTADTLKNAMTQFGPDGVAAHVIMHPVQSWHDATVTLPDKAAAILGGAVQHVREMSPADQQGTAPKMDTADFDSKLAAAQQKFGTLHRAASTIADHPAGTALAAASVIDPALRVAGVDGGLPAVAAKTIGMVRDATPPAPAGITNLAASADRRVVQPAKRIVTAQRTAETAADTMRTATADSLLASQTQAQAAATTAADLSDRVSAIADTAKARSKALSDRSSTAAAQSAPPAPNVGDAAYLSDIGDSLRTPALANEDAINSGMRAADDKLRGAMQQVSTEQETKGIGVSDVPLAKAMIRQSRAVVSPDAVKRPAVGMVPADSAGAKLHQDFLNVMQPQQVPLSDAEAIKAFKAGVDVQTGADGQKFRTVKPSLENVEDFRRKVGQILNGDIEGYPAINKVQAQGMYGNLSKVIDKYVKGASAPVQANWRMGKQALAPFENARMGKTLVGTQAGTAGIASVPAASIPGRIVAGGRDTLKQAASVAGDAPVTAALRSQVQNILSTAKSGDAAEAMVHPGTILGDAVNTDNDLSAAVRDHIAKVRQAEMQGKAATDLTRRSATASSRGQMLDKAANALQTGAANAVAKARGYEQEISSLAVTEPRHVGAKYVNVLQRAHAEGSISTEQLNSGLQLAQKAEKAFALKETRDAWVRQALVTAGVSALGAGGVGLFNAATH